MADSGGGQKSNFGRDLGGGLGGDPGDDLTAWITRDQRELPLLSLARYFLGR